MDIHYFRKQLEVKQQQQNETFKHILEKCQCKMKMALEKGYSAVYYEVPEFVIGKPVYNLNDCIEYIGSSLVKSGFAVKYYFPRVILVSWHKVSQSDAPAPTRKANAPAIASTPATLAQTANSEFVKHAKKNKNKKLTLEM